MNYQGNYIGQRSFRQTELSPHTHQIDVVLSGPLTWSVKTPKIILHQGGAMRGKVRFDEY